MAYLKPQSPIKYKEDYIYPPTTIDQIIMEDGQRLSGVGVYLNQSEEQITSYIKPNYPLKNGDNYMYPQTTADQVLLSDGSRLEQNGQIVASKLHEARAIALAGDVIGSVDFDGSQGVTINTTVSASKYYTATFTASGWSDSAPYTQTVNVEDIKVADNPIVDINMSSATDSNSTDLLGAWMLVGRVATANGSVTAYCYEEKPEVDITVNLMVVK